MKKRKNEFTETEGKDVIHIMKKSKLILIITIIAITMLGKAYSQFSLADISD